MYLEKLSYELSESVFSEMSFYYVGLQLTKSHKGTKVPSNIFSFYCIRKNEGRRERGFFEIRKSLE